VAKSFLYSPFTLLPEAEKKATTTHDDRRLGRRVSSHPLTGGGLVLPNYVSFHLCTAYNLSSPQAGRALKSELTVCLAMAPLQDTMMHKCNVNEPYQGRSYCLKARVEILLVFGFGEGNVATPQSLQPPVLSACRDISPQSHLLTTIAMWDADSF
jgi:hypothetical protein